MKQQIKKEIICKGGELKSNAQRLTTVSGVSLMEAVVVVVSARRLGRGSGGCGRGLVVLGARGREEVVGAGGGGAVERGDNVTLN